MRNPLSGASYANVTATFALVVALGGTSYAAATIGTSDLQKNAVTSPKIKQGAVRSTDLRDGTIRLSDVSVAARTALKGSPGASGPQGPAGTNGVSGRERLTANVIVGFNANGHVSKDCSPGKKLVGASARFESGFEGTSVRSDPAGATAYGHNDGAADVLTLYLICVAAL